MKSLIPWRRKEQGLAPGTWGNDWLERVWENPFGGLLAGWPGQSALRMPSVDIAEDKHAVTVRAEVPGMTEKDIELTWHEGVLRIRGEKKEEKEDKKGKRSYSECRYGYFSRDIPLDADVDWKAAKARYRHGVLTVTLPRAQGARKAVEVEVS